MGSDGKVFTGTKEEEALEAQELNEAKEERVASLISTGSVK